MGVYLPREAHILSYGISYGLIFKYPVLLASDITLPLWDDVYSSIMRFRDSVGPFSSAEYLRRLLRIVFAAVVFVVFLAIVLSSDVILSDGENLPYS